MEMCIRDRSLSQNVKLGIQYRYQQGEVQVNHKRFLGYTNDENKQLVIEPEGAKVVKRIYREYLEGASLLQIARGLEADGILTAAGKAKWRPETLKKILQNEKYIGDALLQKTYTVDFLSKKRVKNNGIVPQYYVETVSYTHLDVYKRQVLWNHLCQRQHHTGQYPPCLQCIRCQYDDGVCRYDYDQQGIFFVYPYADLFLWKHQRDDYYQNDSHFGQVDAAAFSGQPDP